MQKFKSFNDDVESLKSHVSNQNPSTADITKMHDMVHTLSRKYPGTDTGEKLYSKISKGTLTNNIHQKFKDAATLDD